MKRIISIICILLAAFLISCLLLGESLISPAPQMTSTTVLEMQLERVVLETAQGDQMVSWTGVPPTPRGVVLLLHGFRGSSADMAERAALLMREGFAVMIPDHYAHGESSGKFITFGYIESRGVSKCLSYLRNRFPGLRVGVVGVSLGGAAAVFASDKNGFDAMVLESVYPTIEEALDNRLTMRIGLLSKVLTPLLLWQLQYRIGITAEHLKPVSEIKNVRCPLLIASGDNDRHTTPAQTMALYTAANFPKSLWIVQGAGHTDLQRLDSHGYSRHVLSFLNRELDKQR